MSGAADLSALQGQFQDYVVAGDDRFAAQVRDTSKAKRAALLGVYRDAYWLRLVECLATDYPGLRALLGASAFQELARAYLRAFPSRVRNVRWFGKDMPGFAGATLARPLGDAAHDMAAFEWALGEAHDAADAGTVTFADLAGLRGEAWTGLRLQFHPSVRTLTLATAAPTAWLRRDEFADGGLPVEPAGTPGHWLIWRQMGANGPDVNFRSMNEDEAGMIALALAGGNFPALCEALERYMPADEAPARAAGLLRAWVDAGLIAGHSTDG